jgi:hypothetical protein
MVHFPTVSEYARNADEIGISTEGTNFQVAAKTERNGTETAESERKTGEKTGDDSPSVRTQWAPDLAQTNKSLARTNKSPGGVRATNERSGPECVGEKVSPTSVLPHAERRAACKFDALC